MLFILLSVSCTGMGSGKVEKTGINDETSTTRGGRLPFVGKREFIRPQASGLWTTTWFVEIMRNGDVYFSYKHNGIEDGWSDYYDDDARSESYFAGTFKKYMRCYFPDSYAGLRFYEITNDRVYEVDEQYRRINNRACCPGQLTTNDSPCPCSWTLTIPKRRNTLIIEGFRFSPAPADRPSRVGVR